jgi:hypothetical protein
MTLARRRIERLQACGRLKRWAARWDLQTVDYLERHPERKLPEGIGAWLREAARFFQFTDPGAYRILRVLVIGGAMPEPSRLRATGACAACAGGVVTVLEYVVLIGVEIFQRMSRPRGLTLDKLGDLANLALVFSAGGVVMAVGLYFVFRSEFRKMDAWIKELD